MLNPSRELALSRASPFELLSQTHPTFHPSLSYGADCLLHPLPSRALFAKLNEYSVPHCRPRSFSWRDGGSIGGSRVSAAREVGRRAALRSFNAANFNAIEVGLAAVEVDVVLTAV